MDGGETRAAALYRQLEKAEIEGKASRVAEIEAELDLPALPRPLEHVWEAYERIRRRKGTTDMGSPRPIEWPDIQAFLGLSGVRLTSWEIGIIERLDDLFLAPEEKPSAPGRPMTEKLFDTIFK